MLGLGKDVLRKIQNLLVQIDNKKVHKSEKDNHGKTKQKSKAKTDHQQSITKIKKSKASRIQEQQQNICPARIQQLYLNHFIRQKRLLDRNLQNFEQEMRNVKTFKVQNKKSQYLNQKQRLKPIYERTEQILLKKQRSIEKIKESAPRKKQQIEDEQIDMILQEKKKKYPRLTKEQFQQKMQEIQKRNLMRMQKIHKKKLMKYEQKNQDESDKPALSTRNDFWWEKKRLKKNLSSNVFERFEQYDIEKRQKWENYLHERQQQQTPFTPKITEATRQIAKRSLSRRSLYENMSRSHSCRALSRKQQPSFVQKRSVLQTERSLSKSRNHHKSSTTANTSRHALFQKKPV